MVEMFESRWLTLSSNDYDVFCDTNSDEDMWSLTIGYSTITNVDDNPKAMIGTIITITNTITNINTVITITNINTVITITANTNINITTITTITTNTTTITTNTTNTSTTTSTRISLSQFIILQRNEMEFYTKPNSANNSM